MPTLGEYRVGLDFNPSGNPQVGDIKAHAAAFIDLCIAKSDACDDPEIVRLWRLASDLMEDAAMWAVKAATKKPRS